MTRYVATVNTPGYLPWDDDPPVFDAPQEAWQYLADHRERAEDDSVCDDYCEDGTECPWREHSDYTDALAELVKYATWAASGLVCDFETVGTVYADTPGYHGDHDLGLAYSVSIAEDES